MKVAVVGASGMVGRVMLEVLKVRRFPADIILAVASEKSAGKTLEIGADSYTLISIQDALDQKPDLALFSAGGDISKEYAPKFASVGTRVIDNSSAWRMSPDHKLIVPEINGSSVTSADRIIANPNCSTIQLVMVLAPLHRRYTVRRVVVSTYQSVTGTGIKAVKQLTDERNGVGPEMIYPYQIDQNCIPHCDVFEENGYTREEMKLTNETRKILDPAIAVSATAVRVPVIGGHSESVNIQFETDFELAEVRKILHQTPGIQIQDNTDINSYPMPRYAHGKDDVFVGRIRRDFSQPNTLNLWIVADNLRKGAAVNAVQIAESLVGHPVK